MKKLLFLSLLFLFGCYEPKFHYNDKVDIIGGFFKGVKNCRLYAYDGTYAMNCKDGPELIGVRESDLQLSIEDKCK